jgi:hypothetical protein
MKTDYEITGKTYKTLYAYTKSYRYPKLDTWYWFAESTRFETCKSFKKFLETQFPSAKFRVHKKEIYTEGVFAI